MAADDGLRISVAMTTYQGERHLARQLESILGQTRLPDEVVVSDDASTDSSWEIVRTVAAQAPLPFRVLRNQQRLGLRSNIEKALTACDGSVIVLADQDDLWAPTKVETLAAAFTDPDVTLWFSDGELIDDHDRPLGGTVWGATGFAAHNQRLMSDGHGLGQLLHGQTVTGATMAVRDSVVRLALPLPGQLEGPEHLFLHDGWLAVVAAVLGTVSVEPQALTSYRQHESQVTAMSMARPRDGTRRSLDAGSRGAQLLRDHARVALVADRIRTASVHTRTAEELFDRECLLAARALPRSAGRARQIWRQLKRGAYHRYSSGTLTALSDLLSPPILDPDRVSPAGRRPPESSPGSS